MRFLTRRVALLPVLFGLLGLILVFFITQPYGVGISGDSVDYIATADHLLKGLGFLDYAGEPYLFWPPLYPLLLAGLSWLTGGDPVVLSGYLNAICFALIVTLAGLLFHRSFQRKVFWSSFGSLIALTSREIWNGRHCRMLIR